MKKFLSNKGFFSELLLSLYAVAVTLFLAKYNLYLAILNLFAAIIVLNFNKDENKDGYKTVKDKLMSQKQALTYILKKKNELTDCHKELLELMLESNSEALAILNTNTLKAQI